MNWIASLLHKKWFKWSLISGASIVAFFTVIYISVYLGFFGKTPNSKDLSHIKQAEATQVLDANGALIGKYYIFDRQPLSFEDFPQHLIDALVATEDVRFYQHDGVDNVSLLRVFVKNILLRDQSAGGGSTITLQLAKNLFGRKDYVMFSMLINKFKESIIAKRIEEIYTKKEILTLYLNTVPFSDNTFGIESASRKFFNKPTKALSLSEAATLVGTLKASTYYNPRLHLKRAEARRNVVFQQMLNNNYLAKDAFELLKSQPLNIDYKSFNHDVGLAPYFRAEVKRQLAKILDSIKKPDGSSYDLYRDGLVVHTTLDSTMQVYAEAAMKAHLTDLQKAHETSFGTHAPWQSKSQLVTSLIKELPVYKSYKKAGLTASQIIDSLSKKHKTTLFSWEGDTIKKASVIDSLSHYLKFLNTGMLSINPKTGGIKTYIGGIDFRFFQYDHVSQSERQVGSTFKPFVYTTAIENGMKPCTYFSLASVTYTNYDDWTPTNSGASEDDPYINYSLEKALSNSVNTIAVKVLNEVGILKVIEQAKRMGITKELPEEPSLALGVAEINLQELTGAYASFVNESKHVKPYAITKIEDKNGKVIATFKPEVAKEQDYSDYTRQVMLQIMQSTVNTGTAARLRSTYGLKNDIAGKTGTTQNNKDGWFVGITPHLVTVTWVGNDNHHIGFKTTGIGQGANSALPIFAQFYKSLNNDSQFKAITQSHLETPTDAVLNDLDCETEKRDGFLKRLFGSKKKEKTFKGN
ncbi:penicillin-binding protein 1A [Siansivirga zeaxanthinifaciens]|uniref:penicillin-binding protein 1A n=1 Tax=Siansivirga zeaxanthinifaciens TaxID=762954 RepID=UPI0005CC371C|nr:transglycosylase domain-containing protein [Siansivirga zeaxanthinifaciens]